ncbi:unnamed protein product, partial [Thelazia callipaeda]|uniref:Chromo domain-containing protein n=1 Tax=Thelazia callipaeda TaxID=103827 RepID=A0A0N5CN64_THECL
VQSSFEVEHSENITCDNDNGSVDLNVGTKNDENEELEQEYVVEKILGKRYNRRQKRIEYLIKWAGYDSESENTWEPSENCVGDLNSLFTILFRIKSSSNKFRKHLAKIIYYENDSKNIEEEKKLSSKSSKKKDQGIETESISIYCMKEWSSDIRIYFVITLESRSDINKYESKRARIDRVLGVKKSNNEILALVRFDDGHHDLVRTQEIVEICPKVKSSSFTFRARMLYG